jgi:protein-glutamine gamma-glutamyltransferase
LSGGGAMTFGREKRLLLGVLVLVAAVPLPFNDMVGWGTFGAFALAVALFLHRAWRGEERWLPAWAANLAAIGYVPFLLLDLQAGLSGVPVQPMLRLGLFAVAVKLFSLSRERDKWHAVLGAFFLFLAAMATSVHLSLTIYLLVFLGLALLLLARFALLHLLAGFGWRGGEPLRVPLAGFLTAVTMATAVVAVPLFATLPRVDAPFLGGPGVRRATGGEISLAGYSDQVTLDSIGRLRDNREVALRLAYRGPGPRGEVRLKGGSYERFRNGGWVPSPPARRRPAPGGGGLTLASGTAVGSVVVQRMPLRANSLPLPVEALRVEDLRWHLALDRGGSLSSTSRPRERLDYEVVLGRSAVSAAQEPEDGPDAATLDLGGMTPRMAALASTVAGTGPPAERAQRLERYLIDNYEYTLDLLGRPGGEPIDRFLFEDRRGHCEYFASALVLLLRTQGIHARLVTGFLGAERNALDLWVVRQGNAHAWVEAWIPGEGWRVLDPTPPGDRPGADAASGLLGLASNLYDALVVQWDRYVLSYDAADQGERVRGLVARLVALWHGWTGDEAPAVAAAPGADDAAANAPAATATADGGGRALPLLVIALGLALAAVAFWQSRRRPVDATRAYRRLRGRLAAAGLAVGETTGPLALVRTAAAGLAAAAAPAERIVALYVKESFGGMPLDDGERAALAPALAEIHRAVREASR